MTLYSTGMYSKGMGASWLLICSYLYAAQDLESNANGTEGARIRIRTLMGALTWQARMAADLQIVLHMQQ